MSSSVSSSRLEGRACGQQVAQNAIDRTRTDLTLLGVLAPSLQNAENAGADCLASDGAPDADVVDWRVGYFEGAEPVVLAFLDEVQAASEFKQAQADALSALTRMEEAAKRIGARPKPSAPLPGLGGPQPAHLLRDCALPMPLRP